jgi:hypothetical protein
MKANVEFYIGELILRGLPYGQRFLIAAAVEAELQRLLDEGGLPASLAAGGVLPEIRVNDLRLAAGVKPGEVGTQIAASIYSNMAGNQIKKAGRTMWTAQNDTGYVSK